MASRAISLTRSVVRSTIGRALNAEVEFNRLEGWVTYLNGIRHVPQQQLLDPDLPHHHLFAGFGNLDFRMDDVVTFRQAGGTGNKYDILAVLRDGTKRRIECKFHTGALSSLPAAGTRAWGRTPQLLNPTLDTFSLGSGYARLWYEKYIPRIRNIWPDLAAPPPFETWRRLDAGVGSARSAFGIAAKRKKEEDRDNVFQSLVAESITEYFERFLVAPEEHKEEFQEFKGQLSDAVCGALFQKEGWLNAVYPSNESLGPIGVRWFGQQAIENFHAYPIRGGAYTTIALRYNLVGGTDTYHGTARLCWRNGNGIANISWHVK